MKAMLAKNAIRKKVATTRSAFFAASSSSSLGSRSGAGSSAASRVRDSAGEGVPITRRGRAGLSPPFWGSSELPWMSVMLLLQLLGLLRGNPHRREDQQADTDEPA